MSKIFEDNLLQIGMTCKKFVSGKGDINAGMILKVVPRNQSLKEFSLEIYSEKMRQNVLFSNKAHPLVFDTMTNSQGASLLAKLDYHDFDENEIYELDITINK